MQGKPDYNSTYPFTAQPAEGWGNTNTSGKWVLAHIPSGAGLVKLADGGEDYTITYDREEATRFDNAADATLAAVKLKAAVDTPVIDQAA